MSKNKPTKEEIKNIILNKQKGVKVSNKKDSESESEDELKKYNINRDSYESSSNAEDLEDYKVDGYHPTQLGEKFSNGRYTVIQKLGWGHFSTVWLVHDKRNNEHFAMKIQKSKKSYCESALDELELLRHMNSHQLHNSWIKFVEEFNTAQSQMKWIEEKKLELRTSRIPKIISSTSSSWESEEENSNEEIQTTDVFQNTENQQEQNIEKEIPKEISKETLQELEEIKNLPPPTRIYQYEIDEKAIQEKMNIEETFCIKLIDNFCHFGVHGKHYCSLFEIMGPTLLDLIQHFEEYDRTIGIWLVKIITRQILQGLVFLHDVCGMIHTDLKPENIMIQLQTSYLNEFVEDMKKLKKRPTSMKYLAIQSQKNQQKNKKKNKKKKKQANANPKQEEEKQQVEVVEVQVNQEIQTPIQPTEQENTQIESKASVDQVCQKEQATDMTNDSKIQKQSKKEDKNEKKPKIKKQFIADHDSDYEEEEEQKKEKESDSEQSESSSESKPPVDEETLYSLKWKEHILIKIDKLIKIKIVDFGNACWTNKKFTDNIQTREYRSPEAILGIDYQANTDIWSVACIVFELLTNNYLFKPKKGQGFGKSDDHLALMIETLGKMNKTFALSGSRSREYFNKNGQLMNIKDLRQMSILDQLIDDYDFQEKDALAIEDFLLPMLEYDPKKRISAVDALKHPWLWTN